MNIKGLSEEPKESVMEIKGLTQEYKRGLYKIQEALFNVGLHENFITLAHLSYFPTNKCKATRHTNVKQHAMYLKLKH